MQILTPKEEEVMEYIWQLGRAAPKDVRALYDDPKPHVNTIATSFHALERKGYLHQLSNTRRVLNAQGITETWVNSVPSYVMLHLTYRWNKQPKKK